MTEDMTVLFEEHVLLGASMEELEGTDLLIPMSYPEDSLLSDKDITVLSDLTGLPYALVSGSDSRALIELSCAGKRLEVGECSFEAVLFGDGRLIGVPLLLRTGESEYCMLDLAGTDDACMEWVLGLSNLRQGNERVFADVTLEDATDMLVPLLIMGPEAGFVLNDYLAPGEALPSSGEVKSLALDRIQALVTRVPFLDGSYIVLVPPARARVLWRSLLSFSVVNPLGHRGLKGRLKANLPWCGLIGFRDSLRTSDLAACGLIRDDGQFVGMRGLLEG